MTRRARVVRHWAATYPDPMAGSAGEPVRVGRADDEYPGWRWCTDPRGREGWMPEALIGADGCATEDYDARELTVSVGDEGEVLRERGGWLWCRAADGSTGWIPETSAEDAACKGAASGT